MPSWDDRLRARIRRGLALGVPVHLTHNDCLDGLACAGLVQRAFPGAAWIGIRPTQTLEALGWVDQALAEGPAPARRPRLLLTDLSLDDLTDEGLGMLARLAAQADIVWLDHHAAQWSEEAEDLVGALVTRLSVDRSGAECAATMLLDLLCALPTSPAGSFHLDRAPFTAHDRSAMRAVAHRDTWSLPHDEEGLRYNLASQRLRQDFVLMVQHGEYRALRLLAETPLRRRRREVRDALARTQVRSGVAYVLGAAPVSDLSEAVWAKHPDVKLLVHFTEEGRLRVRSRGTGLAQPLAMRYGGGGHGMAASAPLLARRPVRRLGYKALGERDPLVRRVLRDAALLAQLHHLPETPPPRAPRRVVEATA